MKKIAKLQLRSETVRVLSGSTLSLAVGGSSSAATRGNTDCLSEAGCQQSVYCSVGCNGGGGGSGSVTAFPDCPPHQSL